MDIFPGERSERKKFLASGLAGIQEYGVAATFSQNNWGTARKQSRGVKSRVENLSNLAKRIKLD